MSVVVGWGAKRGCGLSWKRDENGVIPIFLTCMGAVARFCGNEMGRGGEQVGLSVYNLWLLALCRSSRGQT